MNSLINLDDLTFKEKIKNENELVIINFSAEWCGPCKIMNPILEAVSREENIKIFRVNVDDSPNLACEFGVDNIPVTIFLRSGNKVYQADGLKSKEELREKLYELK
ncbi:thioredoxin family protein [Fusobacterium sp.]|uniref:thioredoxin family protein n=1 Tax=Fusobacterium sp. TaxID=68766 RepID=UPI00396C2E60